MPKSGILNRTAEADKIILEHLSSGHPLLIADCRSKVVSMVLHSKVEVMKMLNVIQKALKLFFFVFQISIKLEMHSN
jgi:hypothetical protein